jgi:hypothetical protein
MSAARDLFDEVRTFARDEDACNKLTRAAELWRADGQSFSSAVSMLAASDAAWGNPTRMLTAARTGLSDLERVVAEHEPGSTVWIAAMYKLRQSLDHISFLFDVDRNETSARVRGLNSELAQQLLEHHTSSANADNYLVRGIVIATDRDGRWETRFPEYEVPLGVEHAGPDELILNIPSAFRLFVSNREWNTAYEIVRLCEDAFTTPSLRGWRAVTVANVDPTQAEARFDEAADAFEADAMPESIEETDRRGGSWSGVNQQLWSKYFRARARLVEAIRNPNRVKQLVESAAQTLAGTEAGWHSSEVSKLHVLLKVLAKLLSEPLGLDEAQARREYQAEMSLSDETEHDQDALTFISEAANGFASFATEPGSALTRNRLDLALKALERIPTLGPEMTEAVRPELGKKAYETLLGPVRTWMHRSLGGINNEARLRGILLRLLQSGLPHYAQIRHGPLEFGKDIVASLDVDGVTVLRLYQVKCGDLDKAKWRESKDEMEEMFQVPLTTFQLSVTPQRTEGVLVTNGHANPFVEPAIAGWLEEQRNTHGRSVNFMHLDTLVDWITKDRLINEPRNALREFGVNPSDI